MLRLGLLIRMKYRLQFSTATSCASDYLIYLYVQRSTLVQSNSVPPIRLAARQTPWVFLGKLAGSSCRCPRSPHSVRRPRPPTSPNHRVHSLLLLVPWNYRLDSAYRGITHHFGPGYFYRGMSFAGYLKQLPRSPFDGSLCHLGNRQEWDILTLRQCAINSYAPLKLGAYMCVLLSLDWW